MAVREVQTQFASLINRAIVIGLQMRLETAETSPRKPRAPLPRSEWAERYRGMATTTPHPRSRLPNPWPNRLIFSRPRMARTACIQRETAETRISLALDLDGTGRADAATGVGFFDHMLTLAGQAQPDRSDGPGQRATCTSTPTTRSRTSASATARPWPRRWVTRPASAATAAPRCRWTRCW